MKIGPRLLEVGEQIVAKGIVVGSPGAARIDERATVEERALIGVVFGVFGVVVAGHAMDIDGSEIARRLNGRVEPE